MEENIFVDVLKSIREVESKIFNILPRCSKCENVLKPEGKNIWRCEHCHSSWKAEWKLINDDNKKRIQEDE